MCFGLFIRATFCFASVCICMCSVSWLFWLGCQYQSKWLTGKTRSSEITYYMLMGTLNPTHLLTHLKFVACCSALMGPSGTDGWTPYTPYACGAQRALLPVTMGAIATDRQTSDSIIAYCPFIGAGHNKRRLCLSSLKSRLSCLRLH